MLFLFQGCIGLSFKKWTGLQDCGINRMDCLKLNRALTMDRIAGLQDLQVRLLGLNWGIVWTGLIYN